ncbi:hypothetical protein X737_19385 [Mesorhizobium sp. L48C026A00]|nr:hypothetical protein X737_19385 [Mesorhizobium sp. L48C026A00]
MASGARIELSPFRAISLSEMRPRHSLLPVEHWKVTHPARLRLFKRLLQAWSSKQKNMPGDITASDANPSW